MNKQSLLNIIMITIIVVLVFYIRTSADQKKDNTENLIPAGDEASCRYTEISGFAPGKKVARADAVAQSNAYIEFANHNNSNVYGGVISKAVLDSLFCGGTNNGIAYHLAMDPSGKHAPANAVFVVVGGVKINQVNGVPTIVSQSNIYFTNNVWCPPSCLSYQ